MADSDVSRDSVQVAECRECAVWQLRLQVALRACGYLTRQIWSAELREVVVDHMAAAWALRIAGGGPHNFDAFFKEYCKDVERDRDAWTHGTVFHDAEYKRIWVNHAAVLSMRLDLLRPRFEKTAA